MRKHIGHLVTSFDTGGLQNGLVNLINHGSDRYRHTVISMRPATGMAERLQRGDVRRLDLAGGRQVAAYRKIAELLRELDLDLLHTRNWGTWFDGVFAASSAGVKRRVHGHHGRDLANAQGERWRRRMIGRLLSWRTDRVICLTDSMRREFRRDFGCAESKIRVIPNGIDLGRIDRARPAEDLDGAFRVVAVGRLDPVKNFPLLIRAFGAMSGRQPSDRLLIVGGGPEEERLRELIRGEGLESSVRILGERKDVAAIMKSADLFVQPSFYEGMSNTIVEAMAAGCPVIATDVGGNADVTGRDGAARLVPSDDVVTLAAALAELRADESARGALGAAGSERVRGRFTLDGMVGAYEGLYGELLGD